VANSPDLIVLLSMPRSGSHFLRAAIAAGGAIVNLDEPFNPDLGDRPYRFDRFLRSEIAADTAWRMDAKGADAILARYFERLVREGNGSPVLVDIKDDELRIVEWPATDASAEPRVLRHILKAGYPIVRLERRDLLAQYASVRRAMLTGEWVTTDSARPAGPSLRLDYELARRHMAMIGNTCHNVRRWIRHHPAVLTLRYETLIENDRLAEPARRSLSAFLGTPIVEGTGRMPRKLAPPLDRLVANLDEIGRRLAEDALAWLSDLESPQFRNEALAKALVPPAGL
jgi:LPS sulfotransferase NodH